MTDQPDIVWTERDYACAQALLARVDDPELTLPTLTDEAIVALDGIDREQMTALPWLDENAGSAENRELVCNAALRGLLTSGVAFPLVLGDDLQPSGLAANEETTAVMALRRTGERIITAELKKDNGNVWLYGYVHGEVVLEELVDSSGTHLFMLTTRSAFPTHIMELANAAGLVSADGQGTSLTVAEFTDQAGTLLKGALGVTSITGVGVAEETFANYTLYSTAEQLLSLTPHTHGGAVKVELTPVSAATAKRSVTELVEKGLS